MKQVEVQIMQQSYLLACPEGRESRLLDAVERLDTAMCKIRDAGKVRARDRIAVLAALNFAFELADRETADLQAQALARQAQQAGSTAQPNPDPATHAAEDPARQARLSQLMAQLDAALGDDGHLI
ncbi:cell division protein ZapA [Curvibacter sp. RS43]|uniref:Cell division protein ZapA n=1 Tax=Curvibacter microcysteis TaxID=3026419 RepID=A0ABT5MKL0_9BURK|nr:MULTISPECIES: cell division protein ZapA [unclassified Curvibacter]MDD0808889.1 cell division protein ZapA [Curvibacter sp. RS43]MDD0817130.1 cell division protein ZapA [Curvibacter sp. HBC28]